MRRKLVGEQGLKRSRFHGERSCISTASHIISLLGRGFHICMLCARLRQSGVFSLMRLKGYVMMDGRLVMPFIYFISERADALIRFAEKLAGEAILFRHMDIIYKARYIFGADY